MGENPTIGSIKKEVNKTPITKINLADAKFESYQRGYDSGKQHGDVAQYEKGFQDGKQHSQLDLKYAKEDLIRVQGTLNGFREATQLFLAHYEPIDRDTNDEY